MGFSINAGLLDAMVLSIVQNNDTYGYEITQYLRKAVDISESTLYPVLRRLQKGEMLETYDKEFMGRNRGITELLPRVTIPLRSTEKNGAAIRKKSTVFY